MNKDLTNKPYWLYVLFVGFCAFAFLVFLDGRYEVIFFTLVWGLWITVYVAIVSFILAVILGVVLAMAQLSHSVWLVQVSRLYIEIIRGVPTLVILLYVTFVGAPMLVELYTMCFSFLIEIDFFPRWEIRDFSNSARAVVALAIAYSAFLAEVFRAGILSVDHGQTEACIALGMSRRQTFLKVICPQAFRTILPVLGNDFIAITKDSSLVSVLGVNDVTQLGKLHASATFLMVETYNVVAILYLMLTVGLSLLLRKFEKFMRRGISERENRKSNLRF